MKRPLVLALLTLGLLAPALRAITITEGGTDFPQFNNAANIGSFTYTLDTGNNTISGTATSFSDQQDNFRVVVPAGKRISQVTKTNTAAQPVSVGCDFNLETLTGQGTATFPGIPANGGTPYPLGAGTYSARAYADAFSNAWSFTITVVDAPELAAYWDFDAPPVNGVLADKRAGLPAKVLGGAFVGASGTGKSGVANDRSVHFGFAQQRLNVSGTSEAAYLTSLAAQDKMSVVYWVKQNQRNATPFRFEAPVMLPSDTRNFAAHAPWSDNSVYFDTAGCCDSTRRLNVATTGVTWTDWHHFAFVKDGTDKRIYRDGSLLASGTGAATIARAMTELFIGNSSSLAEAVDGDIDDFAVYTGALGAQDVAQLQSQLPSAVTATPPDSDGDGLPDKWELRYAANLATFSNPAADADSDGLSNAAELAYGTNPTVANTMVVTTTALTGAGSLPQLLTDAAAAPGPNVITFSPTVFTGVTSTTNTITLTAELTVDDADGVAIDASGIAAGVTIDGGAGTNRIFSIGAAGNLTLNKLTLTGGNGSGSSGGAISNLGMLTVEDCAFTGNQAITNGGAITSNGHLVAMRCTFSGNSAATNGGAVACNSGTNAFTLCTFANNAVTGNTQGGGAINYASAGTNLTLTHCTVTANSSAGTQGGGGLRVIGPDCTITNSIIAGNTITAGTGADIFHSAALAAVGSNIVQSRAGAGTLTGTLINAAPLLGPLANNGGPTRTMLPLPGSPARDRITSSTLTTDQRGVARRQWGRVDIGAVEASVQADCAWEVREVWRSNLATLIQSHADADALLADPAALDYVSTAAVINFSDPGYPGSSAFFGSETAYPADNRTAQGLVDGNDNDFALLARTYITIATEDDYTFGFSSDDGARLRLFAAAGGSNPSFSSSTRLNTGNPADPAHSGNTLTFDAETGNADTLGVVHLLAGTYGVEFLSWERAAGAQCEVFLARGARTAVDGNFRLLGETGGAVTQTVGTLSAAAWTVTEIHNGANSYEAAIDQVVRSWCGETIPGTTTTNNAATINYYDPQNGGGGHGLTQTAFPGNTAADDDNFAVGARATITIPTTGDYTFNVLGDDGVRFRILGSRGWTVSGGAGATALPDGFAAPGCCADAFGQVRLASGTYQIEVIFNEIAGGAYLGVWAAPGWLTTYDSRFFSLLGSPAPVLAASAAALARMTGLTRPLNDDFAAALTLTGATARTASCNAGGTMESGEPATNLRTKSVWWNWTAPAAGSVQVDTIGSSFDTVLTVLTGTAVGSLTQVALDDDGGGSNTSKLAFTAAAGTTYRIQVSGYNGKQGTIRLNLGPVPAPPAPPANDAFASATDLGSGTWATTSGTNVAATAEPGEPDAEPSSGDAATGTVWHRWTAPATGRYIVDTVASNFDTVLGVFTGTAVNALTAVASDDESGGNGTSRLVLAATAGTTYRIVVDGWTTGKRGTYFLTIVPGLSSLPVLTVLEDSAAVATIGFTVGDPARQTTMPVVTVTSNNQPLLPNASLTHGGTNCSARTFTLPAPAANANGTATITISTTVDGVAVSDTFLYTVTPVNDAPSFTTTGRNLIVPASAGAQTTTNWATAISAGPANESAQTLSFTVTTDNPGLFTTPPAVDAAGTLTFTPNPAASGNANVTVVLKDSGGTANGGVDSSAPYYFRITTTGPATGTSVFIAANGSGTGTATIAQTFDSVGTTSIPWVNNSTVPGWYAQINNGATASGTFQPSSGTAALTGLINCGAASGATADRALGSKATGTGNIANISYALVMRNTGPLPVRLTTLHYVEELWRSASVAGPTQVENVTTFYAVSDAPLSSIASGASSATAVAGAGFTAFPAGANTAVSSTTVNTALDGNAAANRSTVNFTPAAGTGPLVLPGQYITVKWTDTNEAAGTDGHQAIDDLSIAFTEEPCAISAIVSDVVRRPGVNPDGSQDTVDFKLSVNGLGTLSATGWEITAPTVLTGGIRPYGAPVQFTGVAISNFTPSLVISLKDEIQPCTATATVVVPAVLGRITLGATTTYLQTTGLPALFRQTGLQELTMDPGTATVTTDAAALTPGAEKCLALTVLVDDTSTGSGFEANDTLKVELISTTPDGPVTEVLTADYDINGDGLVTGGATPLADEFNTQQKANAIKWTSTFLLVGRIPASATSFQLKISGAINGQTTQPYSEAYRFQSASVTLCTDADGDGTVDAWEAAHGTNASQAASKFEITSLSNTPTTQSVTLPTVSGRCYQALSTANLTTWSRQGVPTVGDGNPVLITAPATAARTFWRYLVQPVQIELP